MIELSNNQILVTSTDQTIAPWSFRSFESAIAYTNSFPNRERYYLLVVLKPSGMNIWKQLKNYVHTMREAGEEIDIGVDLIAEQHTTTNEFINSAQ